MECIYCKGPMVRGNAPFSEFELIQKALAGLDRESSALVAGQSTSKS